MSCQQMIVFYVEVNETTCNNRHEEESKHSLILCFIQLYGSIFINFWFTKKDF